MNEQKSINNKDSKTEREKWISSPKDIIFTAILTIAFIAQIFLFFIFNNELDLVYLEYLLPKGPAKAVSICVKMIVRMEIVDFSRIIIGARKSSRTSLPMWHRFPRWRLDKPPSILCKVIPDSISQLSPILAPSLRSITSRLCLLSCFKNLSTDSKPANVYSIIPH